MANHRKQVKHRHEPGQAHELTFSTYQRRPILLLNDHPKLLSHAIDQALQRHECDLLAFVYMPQHVHLLIMPQVPAAQRNRAVLAGSTGAARNAPTSHRSDPIRRVSNILFAIKRPVSFRIKQALIQRRDPLLSQLTIRERPGKTAFRFWQEGSGYDRNIHKLETIEVAIDYIHHNPVRRGLCEDPAAWRWSSYRLYDTPVELPEPELPRVCRFCLQ